MSLAPAASGGSSGHENEASCAWTAWAVVASRPSETWAEWWRVSGVGKLSKFQTSEIFILQTAAQWQQLPPRADPFLVPDSEKSIYWPSFYQ